MKLANSIKEINLADNGQWNIGNLAANNRLSVSSVKEMLAKSAFE